MNKAPLFTLYLDECGSGKPNVKDKFPFFSIGGILVRAEDEPLIEAKIKSFKTEWKIPDEVSLHGSKIRSMKDEFTWLGNLKTDELIEFKTELAEMTADCPMLVHACVISRSGYCNRYLETYGKNTWEMRKSALTIVVERAAKYVHRLGGNLRVVYERGGKKEDSIIVSAYKTLIAAGHPFNQDNAAKYKPFSSEQFSKILIGIDGKTKSNLLLQLADLCLYPITKSRDNTLYKLLLEKKKLIDSVLEPDELKELGIKYYCFDDVAATTE